MPPAKASGMPNLTEKMPDPQSPASHLGTATASHSRNSLWLVLASLLLFLPGFFTLPPMDRDEPRFAQASRQMLETGDYVSLRFQDEARNKKPVGIYWMQASSVQLAGYLGFPNPRSTIWLYRLPSLFGAIGAVLLTYWAALPFISRKYALLAALLFSSTLLLGVEARLAKTDAMVAFTVVAAMGALARARLQGVQTRANAAIFWTAIALGILVKGPITPMIPAFAAIALSVQGRSARWLLALRPLAGLAWCLVLVAPWLVAIGLRTHGAFFADAIGGDMLGKVAAGKELHGAPPLTYLAVFWLTGWPMAPFAALAAPYVLRNGRRPQLAFLLAWLIPAWILFELVPTKLPHYVLPLYPAIAIAIAVALENGAVDFAGRWRKVVAFLLPLVMFLVPAAAIAAAIWSQQTLEWPLAVALLGAECLVFALGIFIVSGNTLATLMLAPLASLGVAVLAYSTVLTTPVFQPFAISPRLAQAAATLQGNSKTCSGFSFATAGYREPSLVFLTSTNLVMTGGAGAAAFLQASACRIAFVSHAEEAAFFAALDDKTSVHLAERVRGINLNGGKALDIGVYVRQDDGP